MKEQIREMTDSDKLKYLAEWLDLQGAKNLSIGNDSVQTDLRRIAYNLERDQTNSLLIAMLESQLKVERSVLEEMTTEGTAIYYMITANKIAEIERQINELKG